MSDILRLCRSSIVKKQIMGVTGLMLCGFLVTHLAGNILIMINAESFNMYAHTLITNPMIYPAEAVLALIFLSHIFMGLKLTMENRAARPQSYYVRVPTGRGATFASSTMPYTGLIILVFLVIHIWHFKFGPVYTANYGGLEVRDLHKLVVEYFQNVWAVAWYLFAMVCLGIHVSHGFWSAFQSIGFNHPRYNCYLNCGAKLFAFVVTLGFSIIPLFCYFQGASL